MATPKEQHDARSGARTVGRGDRTPRLDAERDARDAREDVGPPHERDVAHAPTEPPAADEPPR